MNEQRIINDRRSFKSAHRFPFEDRRGGVVYLDRRRFPDRRLNNILLEVVPVETIIADSDTTD